MYKYHSVQELAQLLDQHWQNTDEFQLKWEHKNNSHFC